MEDLKKEFDEDDEMEVGIPDYSYLGEVHFFNFIWRKLQNFINNEFTQEKQMKYYRKAAKKDPNVWETPDIWGKEATKDFYELEDALNAVKNKAYDLEEKYSKKRMEKYDE